MTNDYNKNVVWIEVLPIKWLVDYQNKLLLSEKLLFTSNEKIKNKNYRGFIKNIMIKDFMNEYFINEIKQPNKVILKKMYYKRK